jgi:hypothetical protein
MTLPLRRVAPVCTAIVLVCLQAQAQDALPFPLQPVVDNGPMGALELEPRTERLGALASIDDVVFEDVLLPGGRTVQLQLQRVELPTFNNLHVDGEPAEPLVTDLTLWRGTVTGSPHSSVTLGFSRYGSRGWIRDGQELVHLLAGPGDGGDWSHSRSEMWTETALNALGMSMGEYCTQLTPGDDPLQDVAVEVVQNEPQTIGVGIPPQLVCKVAYETDYQLFQVFGSLIAEQVYMQTLLGAVSDRYVEQIQTRLEVAYIGFYTDPADPWTVVDDPASSSGDILGEFRGAWAGSPLPGDANLAHMISGDGSGGVAYVDTICNGDWGFAVSGSINGNVNFPVMQNPSNWDFMVIAHEFGHNFGTYHTHNYCPPIDECAPEGYWGSCQDEVACINNGTIMSYCHTCSGGTGNITTYFHPQVVDVMRAGAENSCIPLDSQGSSFCDASDGSLASCPCAQGNPDSGCEIAQTTGGVKLDLVAQDTAPSNGVTMVGTGFPTAQLPAAVVIRARTIEPSPVTFGDGLRCIGTPVVRLGGVVAFGGTSMHSFGHGTGAGSGDFYYQLWFRNTPGMFCTPGAFNLSNGRLLSW